VTNSRSLMDGISQRSTSGPGRVGIPLAEELLEPSAMA
jgi:hypothetical protein